MFNLFDCLTGKDYSFVVKEFNLLEVLKMIHISKPNRILSDGFISIKNKSIEVENNEECYVEKISTRLTNKEWDNLLHLCVKQNYKLIVKDEPDVMYFTKVEES